MTLNLLCPSPPPGPQQMSKAAFSAVAASWQEEDRFDALITQGHKWLFLTSEKEEVGSGLNWTQERVGSFSSFMPLSPSPGPFCKDLLNVYNSVLSFLPQNCTATPKTQNLPLTGGALKRISRPKVIPDPYSLRSAFSVCEIPG